MQADRFLRDTILELKDVDESALTPDLTIASLELDSLDYVEIQVGVKKTFNVVVDPLLFSSGRIVTLGDMADYIEKHRAPAVAIN